MNALVIAPIVAPFATAIVCLLAWRRRRFQRLASVAGGLALLAVAIVLLREVRSGGILVTQVGNWPAPFGITLVADLFSCLMVLVSAVIGLAVIVYSLANIDAERESFGYYPLLQLLLMGVSGAFLAGDIFNLYVWFEVMLIASFVLTVLGGTREQMEAGMKYVSLNLVASVFFLSGVGLLYGLTGTMNMADLSRKLEAVGQTGTVSAVAVLLLLAFGIKAAIFPLFFWLPASYHVPPVAVSAIFAGLLTKVGVYALIRVFTLIFRHDVAFTHGMILVLAGFTMVVGVLGAVAQSEFRRVLSFHIVSQIGYMIMGLGLFTPLAVAGSVFYIVHHILVKANLFLVGGVAERMYHTGELKRLGGMYRSHPAMALLFLVPALSLAGIPPLSGFFAKLTLVKASLDIEQFAIAATALAVSLLTLFSMMKIWNEVFWKPRPDDGTGPRRAAPPAAMVAPIAALAVLTILIGLAPAFLFDLSLQVSRELLAPEIYIQKVLGGVP